MNVLRRIKTIRPKERYVPWVLLGAAVLAYGVLIRSLGFYWDDWEILYLSTAAKTPADIFLFPFRPLHVYLDIFTVKLLGYTPLYWHLLMLAIRYLGGLVFWLLLKEIWPNKPARNAWAALLYLVYPAFLHNSMSVAYRQHFTTALVYLVSIWLMVRAYNLRRAGETKRFWLPFSLSLLAGAAHLFIMEYFAALELWRPLILGVLIWQDEPERRRRLGKLLFFWLPYLVYTGGYVVWRLVYVQNQINDPNQAILLDNLRARPLNTLLGLAQNAFLDLRYLLLGSWVDTLSPELADFGSPVSLLVLVIVVAAGLGGFYLLRNLSADADRDKQTAPSGGVFLLGASGLLLGLAPAWMIGRHIFEGRYGTRFSIPALAAASLVAAALIFYLIPDRRKASAVLAVMLALAIGQQIHMNNEFRWDWQRQTRVYWQLSWRAPGIEQGTVMLVNRSLSSYATTYPVAYAANFLYAPDNLSMTPDYWWLEIYESNLDARTDELLLEGGRIKNNFHNVMIDVAADQVLVFNLPKSDEPTRCVWLLTKADSDNALVAPEMQKIAPLTNLARIQPENAAPPQKQTFGSEPPLTWCYYFQKAELAAQFGDWQTANDLYAQTQAEGLDTLYGHELLPFIRASIAAQDWGQARAQTLEADRLTRSLRPDLCILWEKLETPPADQTAFKQAFAKVNQTLGCTSD